MAAFHCDVCPVKEVRARRMGRRQPEVTVADVLQVVVLTVLTRQLGRMPDVRVEMLQIVVIQVAEFVANA